jgi:hypothetical protein
LFGSTVGVIDRTFPAFESAPCEGIISPLSNYKRNSKQKGKKP